VHFRFAQMLNKQIGWSMGRGLVTCKISSFHSDSVMIIGTCVMYSRPTECGLWCWCTCTG